MDIIITDKKKYLILFLITFSIAFCSSYNPLIFRIMYVDSSVYVTMAQGIIRGYLPYLDLVDNKGPLLYFMSLPGLLFFGLTGVWLTEIIILYVSVLFAFKTALFFGNRFNALLGTIFTFIALLAFFLVNAGAEEYSLPFLFISLYIFTKYFFSEKQDMSFIQLMVLGACLSCAVMIRFNFFPLWIGFFVVIFINLIIKKRFLLLGKNIFGFLLGMFIILIPILLYLILNNIFELFIEQVVLAGAERGFGATDLKIIEKNFWLILNRNNCYLPLMFFIFMLIINFKKKLFPYYLGLLISYSLLVLFHSFSGGGVHYNMVLIPFFIPVLTFLIDFIHKRFIEKNVKHALLALISFFCCMFAEGFIRYTYYITNNFHDSSGKNLNIAGKIIDENTRPDDKIISLGLNGYIYPFTKRDTASKYFYQGSGLDHISGANETFISDILESKPAIITTITEGGRSEININWHAPIMEMIKNEYRLLSDEYGFDIYIRNY